MKALIEEAKKYRKAIIAVVGSALTWAAGTYTDITWLSALAAVFTALSVYLVPNDLA